MRMFVTSSGVAATVFVIVAFLSPCSSDTVDGTALRNVEPRDQPLSFEENRGQYAAPARFIARIRAVNVLVEERALTLQLGDPLAANEGEPGEVGGAGGAPPRREVSLRLEFEDASPDAFVEGVSMLPGVVNHYRGSDPSKWISGVPTWSEVALRDLYPGVKVMLRGSQAGRLEYDVVVAAGADLDQVVIRCEGAESIRLEDGVAVLDTALGEIRQEIPATWQVLPDGSRQLLEARWCLLEGDRLGFLVPERDPALELVIDPGVLYATYLGGTGNEDGGCRLLLDGVGGVVVVGRSVSIDYPVTPSAFQPDRAGGSDIVITRLPLGGGPPSYSTYLGTSSGEPLPRAAMDGSDAVVLCGRTTSSAFPMTPNAFDTSYNGGGDIFVTRIPLSGGPPSYSSFLGGRRSEQPREIELDSSGAAVIAGETSSPDFPTTPNALDRVLGGSQDGFITRLTLDGRPPVYSTYLGGEAQDDIRRMALDGEGSALVVGWSRSSDFPTTANAWQPSHASPGSSQDYLTYLPLSGGPPEYSTFLAQAQISNYQGMSSVVFDGRGGAIVVGTTDRSDYPTTPDAFDGTLDGPLDGFLMRLPLTGGPPSYSTFLGGNGSDELRAAALHPNGEVVVAGHTDSSDYPMTPGGFGSPTQGPDYCVTRLPLDGRPPSYSAFVAPRDSFYNQISLALDAAGAAVFGNVSASGVPTTFNAYQPDPSSSDGTLDAFLVHLDLLPTGVFAHGESTPGCAGALPLGVSSMPQVGNEEFAVNTGHAPPDTMVSLFLSNRSLPAPRILHGAKVYIDLDSTPFPVLTARSDESGAVWFSVPIPARPALFGLTVFAQAACVDPCSPGLVATSNALAITVQ